MPSFKEQIENAPVFAREFIEKVKQEFSAIDGASIKYTGENTDNPDMRIRKIIDKGIGFINTSTFEWQPNNQCLLLKTALNQGEVNSCGLSVEIHKQAQVLSSSLYLDEKIIDQSMPQILKCLKYAYETREHKGHNKEGTV